MILNADFQKFSGVTPLGWGTLNSYSTLCAKARTTFSAATAGACDSLAMYNQLNMVLNDNENDCQL